MIGWGLVEFALSGTLDGVAHMPDDLGREAISGDVLVATSKGRVWMQPDDIGRCTCAAGGDCFVCDETN